VTKIMQAGKDKKKSRSLHEISVKKPGIFVSYHAEGFA
jgi:hypothetical protein